MSDVITFRAEPSRGSAVSGDQSTPDNRRRHMDLVCAEQRNRMATPQSITPGAYSRQPALRPAPGDAIVGSRGAQILCPPLKQAGGQMLVRFRDGRQEAMWIPASPRPFPAAATGSGRTGR